MNLFEESIRMKKLMMLEQSSDETYMKDFSAGNFDKLKELLLNNKELLDKLQELLKTDSVEETEQVLLKPNKTILMRGMTDAKTKKDMEFYQFLEIFLKNVESLS
jgi:hypothetical protein